MLACAVVRSTHIRAFAHGRRVLQSKASSHDVGCRQTQVFQGGLALHSRPDLEKHTTQHCLKSPRSYQSISMNTPRDQSRCRNNH
eukprot:4542425-Amphidinium_carterae.1